MIPEDLTSQGCRVFSFKVPRYLSVYTRAQCLKDQIVNLAETNNLKKFNLIAHSMGGLDARHFITNLDGHHLVASLTTLGTPHHGSYCCDIFVNSISTPLDLKTRMGLEAHHNITVKFMKEVFNPQTPDHPEVAYFSFGGAKKLSQLHPLFISQLILNKYEGENDGLVALESSKWGEFVSRLPLDHAEMINWSFQYDARILFRDLVNFLSSRGF
eukprot:TRINITY_DN5470_c0_g1_i1.p1 TRINITY_DN5470_c0_g1~~TRINITY_DN5470_c0_g1_i1.p1  ORF type:complete len:214 (-),score=27.88 TRINITY_DN5470_c0_g1_i1:80-721(-)